jgi:hypothetical protein
MGFLQQELDDDEDENNQFANNDFENNNAASSSSYLDDEIANDLELAAQLKNLEKELDALGVDARE